MSYGLKRCIAVGIAVLIGMIGLPFDVSAQADQLLLRDYRPHSLFNTPKTEINRAKFPVIDMHSHPYARSVEDIEQWVRTKDELGIERTVILTSAIGSTLDSLMSVYSAFGDRFEVWCGIDLHGYERPDFAERSVAELERCASVGGKGIGEIHDKGEGLRSAGFTAAGMHPDDPRMDPFFRRAGELGLPVNIHIAEPIWMYHPMDSTNDGLMTAYHWRLDDKPDIVGHEGMIEILGRTLARHRNTTFIVVHAASLCHDLERMTSLLDRHPNMYVDLSARYSELSQTPRHARRMFEGHADRILYGTDLGFDPRMYRTTFRILETDDDHFYEHAIFGQHWALRGMHLSDDALRKIYRENAARIIERRNARLESFR
jgi:uncharacterized protein